MDRALKERITGAIILVIFVVLVVPVFLDGPEQPDAVVTERFALPGQMDDDVRKVVLQRDRSKASPPPVEIAASETDEAETVVEAPADDPQPTLPDPVETEPDTSVVEQAPAEEAEPVQVARQPEPEPEPVQTRPQPAPVETIGAGKWAVQLGSFSSEENAQKLARTLRGEGFAAFVSEMDNRVMYRVRVGPQADRPAAEAMAQRLLDAGHRGQVVPHM